MKILDKQAAGKLFRKYVMKKYPFYYEAALDFDVSPRYISDVCCGRRWPTRLMLKAMACEMISGVIKIKKC